MGYGLGVDLGTTFTAAAVEREGRVEMATLGDHAAAVPSVVLVREDGAVTTGDAAARRATAEPDRVAREVKRRFGDPVPLILGGSPWTASDLMAHQLRDVVRLVSEREGAPPDSVTLTHPANWGPYKRELFDAIPRQAGLGDVRMITEPEAAAAHYAGNERLEEGAVVAVYDLGGGTFDATVLRTTTDGFEILGTPEGIEGLGGVDFDEAVFTHVDRVLGGPVARLDPADPRATAAVIRLRRDCVAAKEALSADTEATVPVLLPSLQTEVRVTRGEFEAMIRPAVGATIGSLRRALGSAGVHPDQLSTVLLVGGSSRIPLVARLVSAELGRPTAVDAHPKHAIVLGAAGLGATSRQRAGAAAAGPSTAAWPAPGPATATTGLGPWGPAGQQASAPPVTEVGTPAPGLPAPELQGDGTSSRPKRRLPLAVAAALLLALLAGGGTYAYRAASATGTAPGAETSVQVPVESVTAPVPAVGPAIGPEAPPAATAPSEDAVPAPAPARSGPAAGSGGSGSGGGWGSGSSGAGGQHGSGSGGGDGGGWGGGDGGGDGGGGDGGGDGGGGDGGGDGGGTGSGAGTNSTGSGESSAPSGEG